MLITILSAAAVLVIVLAVIRKHVQRYLCFWRLRTYHAELVALMHLYRSEGDPIRRAGLLARIRLYYDYYTIAARRLPERDRAEAYGILTSDLQNI